VGPQLRASGCAECGTHVWKHLRPPSLLISLHALHVQARSRQEACAAHSQTCRFTLQRVHRRCFWPLLLAPRISERYRNRRLQGCKLTGLADRHCVVTGRPLDTRALGFEALLVTLLAGLLQPAVAGASEEQLPDRVLVWQPLLAASVIIGTALWVALKTGRALEARNERLEKEAAVRALLNAQLAGRPLDEAAVDKAQQELAELLAREAAEKEIFAWGEATPTTIRTSWEVSLPPDDRELLELPLARLRRRGGASTGGPKEAGTGAGYEPPEWVDERAQAAVLLVGVPLLAALLLWVSSS